MLDGKVMREKEFARLMRVQFTPTILFLDEKGGTVARLNGYYRRIGSKRRLITSRSHGRKAVLDRLHENRGEGGGERTPRDEPVLHPAAL